MFLEQKLLSLVCYLRIWHKRRTFSCHLITQQSFQQSKNKHQIKKNLSQKFFTFLTEHGIKSNTIYYKSTLESLCSLCRFLLVKVEKCKEYISKVLSVMVTQQSLQFVLSVVFDKFNWFLFFSNSTPIYF